MTVITYKHGADFASIVFDATMGETHTHDADVTENPVEKGSNVTDNVRAKPVNLRLDVLVTDFGITTQGGGVGQPTQAGRAQSVFDTLVKLRDSGTLLDEVSTSSRRYVNLLVKSVTLNRDKPLTGALRMTLELREIKVVSSQTVDVKLTVADRKSTAILKDGAKTGTNVNDSLKNKSALTQLGEFAGILKVRNP